MRGLLLQEVGKRGKLLLCFPSFGLTWAEPQSTGLGVQHPHIPHVLRLKPQGDSILRNCDTSILLLPDRTGPEEWAGVSVVSVREAPRKG